MSFHDAPSTVASLPLVVVASRIHFPEGQVYTPEIEKRVAKFCVLACKLSNHVSIAVNGLLNEVSATARKIAGNRVRILHVPYWGQFTFALNVLLFDARSQDAVYILYVSMEVEMDEKALSSLIGHMTPNTLVAGALLQGHEFYPSAQPVGLHGRSVPWNTFALWNVRWLSMTGFLGIADGLPKNVRPGPGDTTSAPAGMPTGEGLRVWMHSRMLASQGPYQMHPSSSSRGGKPPSPPPVPSNTTSAPLNLNAIMKDKTPQSNGLLKGSTTRSPSPSPAVPKSGLAKKRVASYGSFIDAFQPPQQQTQPEETMSDSGVQESSIPKKEASSTNVVGGSTWWQANPQLLGMQQDVMNQVPAGVEEVTAVAVIQLLRPSLEAKLVRLPPDSTLNWKTEWQDDERKKWHDYKMATKVARPQAQLAALGIEENFNGLKAGKVLHYDHSIEPTKIIVGTCLCLLFTVNLNAFALASELFTDRASLPFRILPGQCSYLQFLDSTVFGAIVTDIVVLLSPVSLWLCQRLVHSVSHKFALMLMLSILCFSNMLYCAAVFFDLPCLGILLLFTRFLQGLANGSFFLVRHILSELTTINVRERYMVLTFAASDLGIALAPGIITWWVHWWAPIVTRAGVSLPGTGMLPCQHVAAVALIQLFVCWRFFPNRLHLLPPVVQLSGKLNYASIIQNSSAAKEMAADNDDPDLDDIELEELEKAISVAGTTDNGSEVGTPRSVRSVNWKRSRSASFSKGERRKPLLPERSDDSSWAPERSTSEQVFGNRSPSRSPKNGSPVFGNRGRDETSRRGSKASDVIESEHAGTLFHATALKPQAKECLIEDTHQALRRVMICVIGCGASRVFFQFWMVTMLMLHSEITASAAAALWLVPVACIVLLRPEAFRLGSGRYFNIHGGFFLRSIFFGCAGVAILIAIFLSHHPPLWLCAVIMFLLTLSAPINDALATQASLVASAYTSDGSPNREWRWFEDSERVMIIMAALQSYGGRLLGPIVAIVLDSACGLQAGFLVFAVCCVGAGVAAGKWSSFELRKM